MTIAVIRADTDGDAHGSVLSDDTGLFTTVSFSSLGTPNFFNDLTYVEGQDVFVVINGAEREYDRNIGFYFTQKWGLYSSALGLQGALTNMPNGARSTLGGLSRLITSNESAGFGASSVFIARSSVIDLPVAPGATTYPDPSPGMSLITHVDRYTMANSTALPTFAASYTLDDADHQGSIYDRVVSMCITKGDHLLFFYEHGRVTEAELTVGGAINFLDAGEKRITLGANESLLYATCDNSSPASNTAQHKLGLIIDRNGPGIAFRTANITPQV